MAGFILLIFLFGYHFGSRKNPSQIEGLIKKSVNVTPENIFEKYEIEKLNENLKRAHFSIADKLPPEEKFLPYVFKFTFSPAKDGEYKTTSGLLNLPSDYEVNKYPIVILIRGYVDQNIYKTGMGSYNFGTFLANNGFITIAPDFLGYANSDSESSNIFESRFQSYITILSLLKSIEEGQIDSWDGKNIFIWGHSNGGQIAITALEASQKAYPTVLWAPVTKPFPYSVLYYTDESPDGGKLIRSELSKFETMNDSDKFSLDKYLDRIQAKIQLHQGTADDAVPVAWSDTFSKKLKKIEKEVDYHKYPGSDHDMRPSWNTVAERSLEFFNANKQ